MKGFKEELTSNILPFWLERMRDHEFGGFYGRIDGDGALHPFAPKGAVLNCRILWTFSAAYRLSGNEEYLAAARSAFDYITAYFIDPEYGGVYWKLDYEGNPLDTKKQTYAQGFALYGFSEYHRATGDSRALDLSLIFFDLIERYKDTVNGGYFEAFTREWNPIEDMRLSAKDANEKKSMNTHLHILEPYTNLLRICSDEKIKKAHRELIDIFATRIVNTETGHLSLFFGEEWDVRSRGISYGHDIEASWLLWEAAEMTGDTDLLKRMKELSFRIANAASEGLLEDGSMVYEISAGHPDTERHWWVQAEAVVGFMYAWKNSGDESCRRKAERAWEYIRSQIIDTEGGEWYWSRMTDGTVNRLDDKAGFWKCPYHNARMCLEMIEHFGLE